MIVNSIATKSKNEGGFDAHSCCVQFYQTHLRLFESLTGVTQGRCKQQRDKMAQSSKKFFVSSNRML
jgi:hypothetical protein